MSEQARKRVREVRDIVSLVRTRLWSPDPRDRDGAGYRLLIGFAQWAQPGYIATKSGKSWFSDAEFLADYDRLMPHDRRRSAERKYFLRSLLGLVDGLPGDTAECGVATGASSWFICRHFADSDTTHHGFDSFRGLPEPSPIDGGYWRRGEIVATEAEARRTLAGFRVELHPGWIPERFSDVADRRFCFVHVDLALHDPTRDALAFFYPRMVTGGVMLFDDYGAGFQSPGTAKAIDEFMADRPESVIASPTAQAFIVKRGAAGER